ncbi:MAG: AAA family ATPase [Candidatus Aenigmatarchaeota archaeon]
MIIERPELRKRIEDLNKWTMVYGRRKTGKTFLLREFIPHDEYFFVKRDRTILSQRDGKMESMIYDTFKETLQRELSNDRVLVVDEFHRLGDDFFDLLHGMKKNGRLILVSSTLTLSKKLLGNKSPLMGLFAEVSIPIIDLSNIVETLETEYSNKKELMELSMVIREPIAVDYVNEQENARNVLIDVLRGSLKTIPALVGEIFEEEERQLSAIYEGIMRAVATGYNVSGRIADYLFSHNLIDRNDPSLVQQYLSNMVEFGILKKTKVYNKNRNKYSHISPLIYLYYYSDEHYNISERDPSEEEIARIVDEMMPRLIENTVREYLAKRDGLTEAVIETSDYDVDVCLLKFQKPEAVGEVKWKEEVEQSDINRAEEVLSKIEADRRFLFVPDKTKVNSDVLEVMDVTDL